MTTERIEIVISERGSRTVRRNIHAIGTGAQASQGAVKLLRRALVGLGGIAILGNAIRTLAQFSQAMSTVRAITGATEQDFKSLREEAKRLGATTRFSATEAADGMTFLARAGFKTNEVLASIDGTLRLAQSGALDLATAADIASNVLKGFNLSAAETGRVVDVLALTANSANTNVLQLGSAMSFVAPAASALGVDVETTAAAIGSLSDAGVQATRAGTGLRQIFIQLLGPTGKALKVLQAYGITTADVNIQSRGLIPVLETLSKANIGLGEAAKLVGRRQATALLILIKSIPKLKELTEANRNAAGTAKEVARIMDDNLNGALFAVKSAFEAVIIAAGDLGSEGFLEKTFRGLASVLRFMAKNIDDVVAALRVLGFAFLALKLPFIIGLFKKLALVIALNPFVALGTAIVLTASALTLFRDQLKLTKDGTVTLNDGLRATSDLLKKDVTGALNSLGAEFFDFGDIMDTFSVNFSRGLIGILAATRGTVKAMIAAWDNFPAALKNLAVKAFNGFLSIVESSLNSFTSAISKALNFLGLETSAITFNLGRLKEDGGKAGQTIGEAFKQGFEDVIRGTFLAAQKRRQEEGGAKIKPLVPSPTPTVATPLPKGISISSGISFKDLFEDLKRENTLLSANREERERLAVVLDFESQLKRKLTTIERGLVETLADQNAALRIQDDLLSDIVGPAEDYKDALEGLNILLIKGKINQEQFTNALRESRISFLNTQKDVASGIERSFLKLQDQVKNTAAIAEEVLTSAFRAAEDAVVSFVQNGTINLNSLGQKLSEFFLRSASKQLFAGIGELLGFKVPESEAQKITNAHAEGGERVKQKIIEGFQQSCALVNAKFSGGGGGGISNTGFPGIDFPDRLGDPTGPPGSFDDLDDLADVFSSTPDDFREAGGVFNGDFGGVFDAQGGNFLEGLGGIFSSAISQLASGNVLGAGKSLLGGLASSIITPLISGLLGFSHGGGFTVGPGTSLASISGGGVDNRLVAFRARDNEEVTITPPGQAVGGSTIIFNIKSPDADGFVRSQPQIINRASAAQARQTARR